MNAGGAPERIAVIWSPEGRSDLRAIDREAAMEILFCLDRYLSTRQGDVKKPKAPLTGFRLRCGNYRLFFDFTGQNTVELAVSMTAKMPTAEEVVYLETHADRRTA